MQFSYSRVETFVKCPYAFKYKYVDNISMISIYEANDARICGNTVHLIAEKGIDPALEFYKSHYNLLTNAHYNEIVKFEIIADKLNDFLSQAGECIHEYVIDEPDFKGIVDLILPNPDGTVDVIDFKYSNNVDRYMESEQLHIYKYYLEKQGFKVNKLGFLFIPKVQIRQKKTESIGEFRLRLRHEVSQKELILLQVEYNVNKVNNFLNNIKIITSIIDVYNNPAINNYLEFKKSPSRLCDWCDYKDLCMKGNDVMALPKNIRRKKEINTRPDFWIYADSYVGKSTFVDGVENLLFINTDGKLKNTTAPVESIATTTIKEGRTEKTVFGWDSVLRILKDLETEDHEFEAVALDLIEDLFEQCRLWVFDKNKWDHESDGGYGKGYDIVQFEFLSTIKKFKNLKTKSGEPMQIIYISKETAKDVTTRQGVSYTTYAPNIKEKIANVLSGTVDMTIRAFVDGRNRYLELGKNDNAFGGGIYNFPVKRIPLNMEEFKKALIDAQSTIEEPVSNNVDEVNENVDPPVEEPAPTRRRRRSAE